MKLLLIHALLSLIVTQRVLADECVKWLSDAKIEKDQQCLIKCASTRVDMGTFHCTNFCHRLCESQASEYTLFSISELYPGLTPSERALTAKYPKKMIKSYQLSWSAERLCSQIFSTSDLNDASDACRHFTWAASGSLSHEKKSI